MLARCEDECGIATRLGVRNRVVPMIRPDGIQESLPHFVEPMLLSAGRPAAISEWTWAVEVKFDGIRLTHAPTARRRW